MSCGARRSSGLPKVCDCTTVRLPTAGLPVLDAHAHLPGDVTLSQITALGEATVFAMTFSLEEANRVRDRRDPTIVWGVGLHPREATARDGWNPEQFRVLLDSFALVGEIGLDDRGDNFAQQRSIFKELLTLVRGQPMLLSIHSSGATTEVVQHLLEEPPSGAILHWFNGDLHDITKSVELSAYFSVNAAMAEEQIRQMPIERVLCETDFPARSPKARGPADVNAVEQLLSRAWKASVEEVPHATTWSNLRTLSEASGAIERMPGPVVDRLLSL